LKFSGDQRPIIWLTFEKKNGDRIYGVKYNGIGIEAKYAQQIFEPFRRLHGRGAYEGSGIGLAICRKIVERDGGKIWVESQKGKGAHFRFTIPSRERAREGNEEAGQPKDPRDYPPRREEANAPEGDAAKKFFSWQAVRTCPSHSIEPLYSTPLESESPLYGSPFFILTERSASFQNTLNLKFSPL
jgi:hypothetical protein